MREYCNATKVPRTINGVRFQKFSPHNNGEKYGDTSKMIAI
jgi:hypothetical protein